MRSPMQILSRKELVCLRLAEQPAEDVEMGRHRGPVEQLGPAVREQMTQCCGSRKLPERARRLRHDSRKDDGAWPKAPEMLRSIRLQRVCMTLAGQGFLRPIEWCDEIGVIRRACGINGERL